LVVNPEISGFAAISRMPTLSAPSAKILVVKCMVERSYLVVSHLAVEA
jgi:hypothetical protein